MLHFFLNHAPKHQKRHRMGRGFTYDPSAPDKKQIIPILKAQRSKAGKVEMGPALRVEIQAVYDMPKSYTKTKRKSLYGQPKITKPDVDNVAKFYLDVMSGLVYDDDNVVAELSVRKRYIQEGESAFVRIIIENVK